MFGFPIELVTWNIALTSFLDIVAIFRGIGEKTASGWEKRLIYTFYNIDVFHELGIRKKTGSAFVTVSIEI